MGNKPNPVFRIEYVLDCFSERRVLNVQAADMQNAVADFFQLIEKWYTEVYPDGIRRALCQVLEYKIARSWIHIPYPAP